MNSDQDALEWVTDRHQLCDRDSSTFYLSKFFRLRVRGRLREKRGVRLDLATGAIQWKSLSDMDASQRTQAHRARANRVETAATRAERRHARQWGLLITVWTATIVLVYADDTPVVDDWILPHQYLGKCTRRNRGKVECGQSLRKTDTSRRGLYGTSRDPRRLSTIGGRPAPWARRCIVLVSCVARLTCWVWDLRLDDSQGCALV